MNQTHSVVNPQYAKTDEYRKVLEEINTRGKCPFCPDELPRFHKEPTLFKIGEWQITRADFPYEDTLEHFILLGETHKIDFLQLTDEDWLSVRKLFAWAITEFNLPGGACTLRFGDPRYTGATVRHLHFHLIVPRVGKVVNFPIG